VPGCTSGRYMLLCRLGWWSATNFGAAAVRTIMACAEASLHLTNQCRMGPRARSFLAAKCHVAKENWEEALQVLGESPVRPEPELSSRLSAQLLTCARRSCRPKRVAAKLGTKTTVHQ
jgi:hypothetical protein